MCVSGVPCVLWEARQWGSPEEGTEPYHWCPSRSVQWEPVQYFNNKIICDLVEEEFKGIISILVRVLCPSSLLLGDGWEASYPLSPSVSTGSECGVGQAKLRCWPSLQAP